MLFYLVTLTRIYVRTTVCYLKLLDIVLNNFLKQIRQLNYELILKLIFKYKLSLIARVKQFSLLFVNGY